MFKSGTILLLALTGLFSGMAQASLQGKWNVTELVTVKTTWNKQTQVQAQKNDTTFTFKNDRSFARADKTVLLGTGTYRENVNKRTFNVFIKGSSYSDPFNTSSIRARIQNNLAERGYQVVSFVVKTTKFTGQVFNEKIYLDPLSEDVHFIQGSYSYTVILRLAPNFSSPQRQTMTIKVDSVFSGSKDATETGSLDWAIANKKKLWPAL